MRNKNSIIDLLAVRPSDRDPKWLKDSLQAAVELEFFTLPPYLAARWSIKNGMDPVARSIRDITREEMLHMGLACNLLVAVGGSPRMNTPDTVPTYPDPLPGGVNPNLEVSLQGLSRDALKVFMQIEYPESGPIASSGTFGTIGEFYAAIQAMFDTLQPPLTVGGQLSGHGFLSVITSLQEVKDAIDLIRIQGEGSATSPEETRGDLAHYYRFGQVYEGRHFIRDPQTGKWGYNGKSIEFPEVWPMGVVPKGGYLQADVSADVWSLLTEFDQKYTQMVNQLQSAWANGDENALDQSRSTMYSLHSPAVSLMKIPIPNSAYSYGPCFRI